MKSIEERGLSDLFRFGDGSPVSTAADWMRRREEIGRLIVSMEYGGLPSAPSSTPCEELHTATVRTLGGARFMSLRVNTVLQQPFSFLLTLLIPPGAGPFPVVLTGDACWRYATDEVAAEVVRRGYILAQFNRTELAPDVRGADRMTGLYRADPQGKYGALAAWAWGFHRCVDVLTGLAQVDAGRIAVTGHSRGGKAALLAGATDTRIALTCANNSGCGGAGSYRFQGPESETLADLLNTFPHWLGPQMAAFAGKEETLPFDQHFLKAMVAPRALLTAEALGDLWANPSGTWRTHLAAQTVYRLLGAEDQLGIHFREGGHGHGFADWHVMLDFMAWRLQGIDPGYSFAGSPFPDGTKL